MTYSRGKEYHRYPAMGVLMMRSVYILLLSLIVYGCSTGSLSINSDPIGSEIIIVGDQGQETRLGQTPARFDWDQIYSNTTDLAQVHIRKEGFESTQVLLPKTIIKHNVVLNLKMNQLPKAETLPSRSSGQDLSTCEDLTQEQMNLLSRGIASTQALIMKGDYEIAKSRLDQLISDFPYLSVLFDLRGNIHYLQKQYVRALDAYEESLRLNPANLETSMMARKLREITGRRSGR